MNAIKITNSQPITVTDIFGNESITTLAEIFSEAAADQSAEQQARAELHVLQDKIATLIKQNKIATRTKILNEWFAAEGGNLTYEEWELSQDEWELYKRIVAAEEAVAFDKANAL